MKKIIPFNNVLTFDTDVREITAISLEHELTSDKDMISGVFYITGEYKMTDGMIETEKFNFELPFDIALGNEYDPKTIKADIDDFRYEIIGNDKLKVNIDMYLEGEPLLLEPQEEVINDEPLFTDKEIKEMHGDEVNGSREVPKETAEASQETRETSEKTTSKELDLPLLDEMLDDNKEESMTENENNNINIFNGFNEEEKYVTYRVYPVSEQDTIDNILTKYNVTKEELAKYNSLDNIKPGDKLIIPYNDK